MICCRLWQLMEPPYRNCPHENHTFDLSRLAKYSRLIHLHMKNEAQNLPLLHGPSLPPTINFPYCPGVSETLRRILAQHGIKVTFKRCGNLRDILTNLKTPMSEDELTKLVYAFAFSCGRLYIGQTGRRLLCRKKEHAGDIRHMRAKTSHSAAHVESHGCRASLDGTKILCSSINYKKNREAIEAALISSCSKCISQPSRTVPPIWLNLCRDEIDRVLKQCPTD